MISTPSAESEHTQVDAHPALIRKTQKYSIIQYHPLKSYFFFVHNFFFISDMNFDFLSYIFLFSYLYKWLCILKLFKKTMEKVITWIFYYFIWDFDRNGAIHVAIAVFQVFADNDFNMNIKYWKKKKKICLFSKVEVGLALEKIIFYDSIFFFLLSE